MKAFCVAAMLKAGLSQEDAELTAEVLVTTDTLGNLYPRDAAVARLAQECARRPARSPRRRIEVVAEGPAWAMVDGHYVMPPATSCRSMELAIKKAKACGVGYVGVKHSSHFGAAGYYAVMAAQQGMIGLSMCNVDPVHDGAGIAGPGPSAPIRWPMRCRRRGDRPVFLDIATSTVAGTKIYAAQAEGKPIPDNWMVDDDGLPTTDPSRLPARGAQVPMAGHKGYGLAVFVEILSAVLTGAAIAAR